MTNVFTSILAGDFADIFGKPRTGVHSARMLTGVVNGGIASTDLLMTVAAAEVIGAVVSIWSDSGIIFNIAISFVILMCIAIVLHYLFGVATALNVVLGLFSPLADIPRT